MEGGRKVRGSGSGSRSPVRVKGCPCSECRGRSPSRPAQGEGLAAASRSWSADPSVAVMERRAVRRSMDRAERRPDGVSSRAALGPRLPGNFLSTYAMDAPVDRSDSGLVMRRKQQGPSASVSGSRPLYPTQSDLLMAHRYPALRSPTSSPKPSPKSSPRSNARFPNGSPKSSPREPAGESYQYVPVGQAVERHSPKQSYHCLPVPQAVERPVEAGPGPLTLSRLSTALGQSTTILADLPPQTHLHLNVSPGHNATNFILCPAPLNFTLFAQAPIP